MKMDKSGRGLLELEEWLVRWRFDGRELVAWLDDDDDGSLLIEVSEAGRTDVTDV